MLLLCLVLSASKPMPDASNPAEGRLATQCVQYFRLEPTQIPLSSDTCAQEGYGLDFMNQHWADIEKLEKDRAAKLEQARLRAAERQAAQQQRGQLQEPCEQLAQGTGPGPDGGQALCDLAGWERAPILRRQMHDQRIAEIGRARRRRVWLATAAAAAALAGVALAVGMRLRRRASTP